MKKHFKLPGKRIFISGLFIISEIIYVFLLLDKLCELSGIVKNVLITISFITAAVLLVNKKKSVYTAFWIAFLLFFPSKSWMYYFVFNKRKKISEEYSNNTGRNTVDSCDIPQNTGLLIEYIVRNTGSAVYRNSFTRYYSCGEQFFYDFIDELKTARKYIYLEYFIFNSGEMWDTVYDVLKRKASDGVDVRIIFDDMCSLMFSDSKISELKSERITAVPFNKVRPFPDIVINQRNHRKIAVIDGVTAFTGGINISDEYINRKRRFGYWKDSAVMIKGNAAGEMAESFKRTWMRCTGISLRSSSFTEKIIYGTEGIVIPFDDSPSSPERVSKMTYIRLINNSVKYVYLMTPYLIPDHDMITALCMASECGIDVRIITPFIPDKKSVHMVTRAYYMPMIRAGVRIFEYVPGFIHSKVMVSDDVSAIAGTANIDYRSFYLLYENGVYMYRSRAVREMKTDFINTLSLCREVTAKNYIEMSGFERKTGEILKIFSCIM